MGVKSQCVGSGPYLLIMDLGRSCCSRQPLTLKYDWLRKDVVSRGAVDDRPRSAPMSWITAMTDRVNALWDAFYARRWVAEPILSVTDKDLDVGKGVQREERQSATTRLLSP